MADTTNLSPPVPEYLLHPPRLRDELLTQTSLLQDETVQECLPLLSAVTNPSSNPFDFDECGLPILERESHRAFLEQNLGQFPAPFVGVDASRPWLIYWGLLGLHLLGEDVRIYRERVFKSFTPLQSAQGGFGGGQGHLAHLACTYAALLSIALVGGDQNYQLVNRYMLWQWLGRLKQPDGGFQIVENGEEDTRAAYCALLAISLLGLPQELPPESPARQYGVEKFTDGLGAYISRCQTYEGGIAGAPGNEAHGAYAFCAVACLSLLDAPHNSLRQYLDLHSLTQWLSSRQYAPEGGLAGRTNKLVDGCYSQWIGGCYPLVQGALATTPADEQPGIQSLAYDLYDAAGLTRYILSCCQAETGGLRDKPSKRPDSYHTCYTLVGLSIAANYHTYDSNLSSRSELAWESLPKQDITTEGFVEGPICRDMAALHPVFVIPHIAVTSMLHWVEQNPFQLASSQT